MRVVYDEGEIERIENKYNVVKEACGCGPLMFEEGQTYGLTFKVENAVIAEYILVGLLYNKLEDFNIGIDIQSIKFGVLEDKNEIKNKLHNMIDRIFEGETN